MQNLLNDCLNEKKILLSDGATGTNLIARGLPHGKTPENWVLENPEAILKLHQDFVDAGSDIILTCTFGASDLRLTRAGLKDKAYEVNSAAVRIARKAIKIKKVLIAGSIGPLGEMLKPLGSLDEITADNNYRQQAQILSDAGVDLLVIETQYDITEASIAVKAAQAVTNLPIVCSFSFDRGIKTMMGVDALTFAREIGSLGVAGLGINCGKSLEENLQVLKELSKATTLPIWFKPNAGIPEIGYDGRPSYDVIPEKMASFTGQWIENGARIIGGCCGTTPEHLRAIRAAIETYLN